MQSVDLTEPLEAIKLKHGDRWYLAEDAVHDAEALWQGKANRHGVFMGYETITLAKVGSCNAEARIIQTGKGWWAASSSYDYGYGGAGSAPSVWERQAFLNREDALAAIAEEIASSFAHIAHERNGCSSEKHRSDAKRMIEELRAYKTPQLTLF